MRSHSIYRSDPNSGRCGTECGARYKGYGARHRGFRCGFGNGCRALRDGHARTLQRRRAATLLQYRSKRPYGRGLADAGLPALAKLKAAQGALLLKNCLYGDGIGAVGYLV